MLPAQFFGLLMLNLLHANISQNKAKVVTMCRLLPTATADQTCRQPCRSVYSANPSLPWRHQPSLHDVTPSMTSPTPNTVFGMRRPHYIRDSAGGHLVPRIRKYIQRGPCHTIILHTEHLVTLPYSLNSYTTSNSFRF